jgi:uncharacterized protein YjiS (DUF1127 family)
MLSLIMSSFRTFLRYRSNIRQLSQLTDRELSDIGLNRYDVEFAAWRAAKA